nr:MAG: hypothetical protein TU36_02285 [Vulcanisaeta sp. AZ3]
MIRLKLMRIKKKKGDRKYMVYALRIPAQIAKLINIDRAQYADLHVEIQGNKAVLTYEIDLQNHAK